MKSCCTSAGLVADGRATLLIKGMGERVERPYFLAGKCLDRISASWDWVVEWEGERVCCTSHVFGGAIVERCYDLVLGLFPTDGQ